jgi:subtilase family serine protease
VKAFDTCFYGAKNATQMLTRLHASSVDGGQPTGPGSGESILDIEDLAGIAPDASIDVYVGTSPGSDGLIYDPVDPYAAMINTDTDQIISTSWGLCEQAVETGQPGLQIAENELFEQAAAQGQSIFSASGDNGSDDCNTNETSTPIAGQNPLSEDDPSGQPYVTAVGGTTIDDAASTPPLEHVWNDGSTEGGGGGGISQSWVMPSWQATATVPGIDRPGGAAYKDANQIEKSFGYPENFCQASNPAAANSPCRLLPDVSAQADQFTGAITIFEAVFGGWTTIGGTSSATPIWAATLALVNASSTCTSNPATAHGVGFASPLLYAVASNAATYSTSFNDVRTGNNDLYGLDNGKVFNATKGYDLASGLGTPRLSGPGGSNGLAFNLCSLGGRASRPVVSGLAPTQGSVNGGHPLTITVTGFTSGGVSDVASVQFGDAKLAPSQFHVVNGTTITTTVPAAVDAAATVQRAQLCTAAVDRRLRGRHQDQ